MDTESLVNAVKLFKLLSDPTRLKILLCIVSLGPLSPLEISRELGKPSNLVSYHLTYLSRIGVLTRKRVGKRVIYSLADEELNKILSLMLDYARSKGLALRAKIKRTRG